MQSSQAKTTGVSKLIGIYKEFCKLPCFQQVDPEQWNLYLELLLGSLTWNLGTSWNLDLELWNLLDPFLGTLPWNLGTFRYRDLEPLLGTSEDLPWLRTQSFQLLGKKKSEALRCPKKFHGFMTFQRSESPHRKNMLVWKTSKRLIIKWLLDHPWCLPNSPPACPQIVAFCDPYATVSQKECGTFYKKKNYWSSLENHPCKKQCLETMLQLPAFAVVRKKC